MLVFWLALLISLGLSLLISFRIDNIKGWDIFWIIFFFGNSAYVITEILKWPLGKRKIDNSKGLSKYIFRDAAESWWEHPFFSPRESILNVKGKGTYVVWASFLVSFFFSLMALYYLYIKKFSISF